MQEGSLMKYNRLLLIILSSLSSSILILWCTAVWPADMRLIPSLRLKGEYDDNIAFSRQVKEDDFVGTASPDLNLHYASDLLRLDSIVGADFKEYMDHSDFNTVIKRCRIDGAYQVTERYSLSGNFDYTKDTTLESELEETGVVVGRKSRERITGGGGMTYQLDEISNIGIQFNRSNTRYDTKHYTDYRTYTAVIYYNHELNSEKDMVTIQSTYSHTRSDVSKIKNYGLSLGLAHAFTESLRFDGYAGIRYTKSSYITYRRRVYAYLLDPVTRRIYPIFSFYKKKEKDSNVGGIADISLTYKGETSSWLVGYSRGLTYSSYGDSLETQRLYGNASRKLTARMKMGIRGSIYITKSEGDVSNEDNRYYKIAPFLEYRLTEDHFLQVGYSYAREENKAVSSNKIGERNRIWVTLTLRFKGF